MFQNIKQTKYLSQNIINTPVSKALKLHFEPAIIPGETDIPIAIGMLVYDCKMQHYRICNRKMRLSL